MIATIANLFESDRKVQTKTSLQGLFSKISFRREREKKRTARNFAILTTFMFEYIMQIFTLFTKLLFILEQ